MTTLQPRKPYTDEELKALYPPELELVQTQILLRHGERTPVSARFQNAGLHPFWPYCKAASHLRNVVLEAHGNDVVFSSFEWKKRLEAFGESSDAPILATGANGDVDNLCEMGMLTDKGRMTTYLLGERLRALYVKQLGFLPDTIDSTDFMYLRATPVPRALESLQQVFVGLYPDAKRAADLAPPTILHRNLSHEQLLPNEGSCVRFRTLMKAYAKRTADRWNSTPEMDYLNSIYGEYMPEGGRVAVDGKPRLSGIMDTVNSTLAHGPATKLPDVFYDANALETLEKIGVEEWFAGFKESSEYRTLGMGSLLGDITARMVANVEASHLGKNQGNAVIKFGMSGCHDTTLAGTLASLGAYETHRWPPYTSHIALEVFRKSTAASAAKHSAHSDVPAAGPAAAPGANPSSLAGSALRGIGRKTVQEMTADELKRIEGHYVRVRYNDEPVTIPGCKAEGNHLEGDDTFCTLTAFKAIVDKITPRNWRMECANPDKGNAFPPKPEPAGY
ncbi:histidine acid phosphatase [Diaporthe helianthi]|uniref:Histidine acid phosphatase n=1 Tax=Diaporthe helianthi TaxID=158607 RepID=A0A2P5I2X2_DIAHE|nr:histidine acid phosphatase [Diaporthe helianthi]